MPVSFTIEFSVLLVVSLALLAVVTSLLFSPDRYRAGDKLTKPTWVAILGLSVVAHLVLGGSIGIIHLAFTIAALVFLADARPALTSLTRR